MSKHIIIDRRKNPSGKNLGNRQKFLKRTKEQIKESVKKSIQDRSIVSEDSESVTIPRKGIREYSFQHDPNTGDTQDQVLPGNKEYSPGDQIGKPQGGQGGGGTEGSPDGEGEDDFAFVVSKDEYYDILFEDLELPNLIKKEMKEIETFSVARAGYTTDGSPNNLDIERSLINSFGRRLALKNPKFKKIKQLEEEIAEIESKDELEEVDTLMIVELQEKISKLKIAANAIGFIDPVDLRYRSFKKVPEPKNQAVMFCIMDVSASMGEHEKEVAKRFYLLLYLFLQRKYKKVDVVFIRHHSTARECDEEDFFHSKESGGTVVSTGLQLMLDIQKERYSSSEWNLYCAQASDGDNFDYDNPIVTDLISNEILPLFQYMAYVEIAHVHASMYGGGRSNTLKDVIENAKGTHRNIGIKNIKDNGEVYGVFRELFSKEKAK